MTFNIVLYTEKTIFGNIMFLFLIFHLLHIQSNFDVTDLLKSFVCHIFYFLMLFYYIPIQYILESHFGSGNIVLFLVIKKLFKVKLSKTG